ELQPEEDADWLIGRTKFTNREPHVYYHYQILATSSTDTITSHEIAYLKSGVLEVTKVNLDEPVGTEKLISDGVWWALRSCAFFGLVFFVYSFFFRLKPWARLSVYKKIVEQDGGAVEKWNELARTEQRMCDANGLDRDDHGRMTWDEDLKLQFQGVLDSLAKIKPESKKAGPVKGAFPLVKILRSGLRNHEMNQCMIEASQEVDRAMVNEAEYEHTRLRGQAIEFVRLLAIIAPSLGLFGTVAGISFAFARLPQAVKATGGDIATILAPDINFALQTTIAGLGIAIVFSVLHYVLTHSLNQIVCRWQKAIVEAGREI
ncbi:MAG: MotA/TolQ/ExbB proton channel family protein, partial [bacterium]